MKSSTDTKRLIKSRFLRTFARNGVIAIIHLLHPEPIYLPLKTWQGILQGLEKELASVGVSDVLTELMNRKLLIDHLHTDQQELEIARSKALKALDRPTILYLMLAQGCNLACRYCPIPTLAKRYGERLLSFEDAIAGIALWQKHIEEYPRDDNPYFLIFYGGEPLLNREVLERLLPYVADEQSAGRLPKNLELMLCTNGSLIDERLSGMFTKYRVTVAVGIDGPQEHNDRIRITSDGKPTFTVIKRAIKQLVDNGVRAVASVTITPANVHRLVEYPDFLRKLGIAQFGFNLMKGEVLIRELAGGSAENYCRAAARGILFGLAGVAENGQCYEYQLEKKLAALRSGLPFSVDCSCYGNQLVIQADGQVSNCPFLRFDQGYIKELPDTFRIGQTETVRMWRYRLPLLNDSITADDSNSVLDCGGCAWSSSELCGDVTARDTNNAIFTNEVTHELIWTLLPQEQENALRQGEAAHWSYRRIGSLRAPGTNSF